MEEIRFTDKKREINFKFNIIKTFAPKEYQEIMLEMRFARGHGGPLLSPKINHLANKLIKEKIFSS